MKKIVLALCLLSTPGFAQDVQQNAASILQNMIGNLAGQNASLSAQLDITNKQLSQAQARVAELEKQLAAPKPDKK